MVEGLILARHDKTLTLEIGGISIIKRCIESMIPHVSRIIITCRLNSEIEKIAKSIYHVECLRIGQDDTMMNEIRYGLKKIQTNRIFITPGYYPLINVFTYETLLKHEQDIIIPVFNNKKGYPLLINKKVKSMIIENGNLIKLDDVFKQFNQELVEVKDAGIICNVDTIDHYYEVYKRFYQ